MATQYCPEIKDRTGITNSEEEPTGSSFFQEGLEMGGQLYYVVRGSRPEHQAVSRILKAGFYIGVLEPEEDRINH